jgi:hypothetical protein
MKAYTMYNFKEKECKRDIIKQINREEIGYAKLSRIAKVLNMDIENYIIEKKRS